jgi:hypothetical protein
MTDCTAGKNWTTFYRPAGHRLTLARVRHTTLEKKDIFVEGDIVKAMFPVSVLGISTLLSAPPFISRGNQMVIHRRDLACPFTDSWTCLSHDRSVAMAHGRSRWSTFLASVIQIL